jgi:uncharacterized protein (DUF1800 family)
MNRRAFLFGFTGKSGDTSEPLEIKGGLEPFVPSEQEPWNRYRALHLLRRSVFQPTEAELQSALEGTPEEAITKLFEMKPLPEPPDWVEELALGREELLDPQKRQEYTALLAQRRNQLVTWWTNVMTQQEYSLREKMVLFWHDHFACDITTVFLPQFMYKQNALFREYAFGNFKELTKKIVSDPAMLVFLDGARNSRFKPNENFGREILELFTLGEGNYTENDIIEASRAFTGWTINATQTLDGIFVEQLFDNTVKTFMGQSGNFTADDIVDIIFEQPACAEYLARKLYRYFIYDVPDETIVQGLAKIFRDADYEIQPMLEALLASAHFFDNEVHGAQIKSPLDFTVGIMRQTGFDISEQPPNISNVLYPYINQINGALGLIPFRPPNVAGWDWHHAWISTATYPLRNSVSDSFLSGTRYNEGRPLRSNISSLDFIKQFPSYQDSYALVKEVSEFLLAMELVQEQLDELHEEMLQGKPYYEWTQILESESAELYAQNFLRAVFRMPEYQLN